MSTEAKYLHVSKRRFKCSVIKGAFFGVIFFAAIDGGIYSFPTSYGLHCPFYSFNFVRDENRATSHCLAAHEVDNKADVKVEMEMEMEKVVDRNTLSKINSCNSGVLAHRILDEALISPNLIVIGNSQQQSSSRTDSCSLGNIFPLYNSLAIPSGATERSISDAELAVQTRIRGGKFKVTELIDTNGDRDVDRASAFLLGLTIAAVGSSIAANEYLVGVLPDIVRFVIVWVLSFAPLGFVGAGIATPDYLQSMLVSIQRVLFPSYRRRMLQHEAGHFLLGHLLGMPVQGYKANAVKNAVEFYPLADATVGEERAQMLGFKSTVERDDNNKQEIYESAAQFEEKQFFSDGGGGEEQMRIMSVFRERNNPWDNEMLKLASKDEPKSVWPFRGFDGKALDKLTVISLAGVCAEIIGFGNAEGGQADISQLRQIYSSAEVPLTDREIENRVRFAIGYGISQLRRHLGVLDALSDVMERDGSLEECILAIETCQTVSGGTGSDNYEQRRKELLGGTTFVERWILAGGKNADDKDDRVEGIGGGERRSGLFELSGDDPIYAALVAAFLFCVWASTGGLSLH